MSLIKNEAEEIKKLIEYVEGRKNTDGSTYKCEFAFEHTFEKQVFTVTVSNWMSRLKHKLSIDVKELVSFSVQDLIGVFDRFMDIVYKYDRMMGGRDIEDK